MKIPTSTPQDRAIARQRVRRLLEMRREWRPFQTWQDVYAAARAATNTIATTMADDLAWGFQPTPSGVYAYRLASRFTEHQGITQPAPAVKAPVA